jgi:S1-C subfamily serine protease
MQRTRRLLTTLLLSAAAAISASLEHAAFAAANAGADAERAGEEELRSELDAARAELDAAARRLAELHRRAGDTVAFFGAAHAASPVPRSRLGILVGPREGAGVVVAGVTPGGGAEAAGIVAGDVLLAVDDVPLDGSPRALVDVVRDLEPGAVVNVVYERDGGQHTVDVNLSSVDVRFEVARRFDLALPPEAISAIPGRRGARLHDLDADLARYFGVDGGVLVLDGTRGDDSLRSGDVLVSVAGRRPANAAEALSWLLQSGEPVEVEVIRDGVQSVLTVDGARVFAPVAAGRIFRFDPAVPAAP